MNWLRTSLIGAIFLVSFLLIIRWNEFQQSQSAAEAPQEISAQTVQETPSTNIATPTTMDAPSTSSEDPDLPQIELSAETQSHKQTNPVSTALIEVHTDTFHILIDPNGGDIVQVSLPKYLDKIDEPDSSFLLLTNSDRHVYVAQSGLLNGAGNTYFPHGSRSVFSAKQNVFQMGESDDELIVNLTANYEDTRITKRFTFNRNSYLIDVHYEIDNLSDKAVEAILFGRIKRDDYKPPADVGIGVQPFVGAAITTPETNYKKMKFKDIEESFVVTQEGGWVAMVQHYFMSAWIPDPTQKNRFSIRQRSPGLYYLEYTGQKVQILPQSQETISSQFYAGPKIIKELEKISPHLDLTIDFSWLWFISKPLFYALDFIHGIVGNWGIAIILLTCLVKLIFFYPSAMSYRSMAKMRKVMPMMTEIKERYGDDRQRQSQEMMKLYKREGVNPLGGCLPMLLQMPVFIALYWALMESVELRHSPFFFWIQDLSVKDPFFVLPLIMGATMFFQQKLNPTPQDPMQAKIMQMMPIFFTLLFMMFPAGLVLYWVTNNLLSIAQQYVITKRIEAEPVKS